MKAGYACADDRSMLLTEFRGQAAAVIGATPADVFSAITAIDRLPEWNERIAAVTRAPGTPLAEGTEWTVPSPAHPALPSAGSLRLSA